MRPFYQQIGTCTTAVPSMKGMNPNPSGGAGATLDYFDTSSLRDKGVALVNPDGLWSAGNAEFQVSFDKGTTWLVFDTKTQPGYYAMPAAVIAWFRVVCVGLPNGVTINVYVAGLNTRDDH